MSNEFPINIMFLRNEKGALRLFFNNRKIKKEDISIAKILLENFLETYSDKDIEKYNREIEIANKIEIEKSKIPSEKIRRKSDGYIYVIKSNLHYKIGKAKNPKDRLKTYITENPNEIEIILCEKVKDYSDVEISLHKKFKKKNHSREWFNLNAEDINKIKKILKLCQSL